MTVKEVIAKLRKMNQDAEVLFYIKTSNEASIDLESAGELVYASPGEPIVWLALQPLTRNEDGSH